MIAKQLTHLLIRKMFANHEVSEIIITNKDKLFTLTFYKELRKFLKMNKEIFTTFHSQTDEQIKKMNQILKTYLRIYT